jgi:hypothetical protein
MVFVVEEPGRWYHPSKLSAVPSESPPKLRLPKQAKDITSQVLGQRFGVVGWQRED